MRAPPQLAAPVAYHADCLAEAQMDDPEFDLTGLREVHNVKPGPPPSPTAQAELIKALLQAQSMSKTEMAMSEVQREQHVATAALVAVCEFLHSMPQVSSRGLHLPLFRLAQALGDLTNGRQPQLLTAVPIGKGRPRQSIAEDWLVAAAALAVEELLATNISRPQAAQKVGQAIAAAGLLPKTQKERSPAVAALGWRDRLREGPGGSAPAGALAIWEYHRQGLGQAELGSTPADRAARLINMIRKATPLRWR
ncbi:hypothetical protein ACLF3G_03175 [Falsiroseomonas sp. HC035]|uniref:hypothetical protein n=1 Tax=Falsiroseomonas sp. HC035 TaxID=3390999 RepID=UPI003D320201